MPRDKLTAQQTRFALEYLTTLKQRESAIAAGYSPKSADAQASQLLKNPKVAAFVASRLSKQFQKAEVSAERVTEELRRIGFSDIGDVVDENDQLLRLKQIPPEARSAVSSVEVVRQNVAAGDGHTDFVHKIKLWDKPKALAELVKCLGMATEKTEHSGSIELSWKSSESS